MPGRLSAATPRTVSLFACRVIGISLPSNFTHKLTHEYNVDLGGLQWTLMDGRHLKTANTLVFNEQPRTGLVRAMAVDAVSSEPVSGGFP